MHTRSQSRNLHHQQHQAPPPVVEQFNLEEPIENPDPLAPMDDTRTMAQLLCTPKTVALEEVFQDFQDTSKSSNDDTNFVNQEPFVVKQGPGVNSSQIPPQINHNCCYECGDSLDDIFCQRCTCKSCGKGAHFGYNCPPQIPIIPKPEPCNNQTVNEFPQTLPSVQPASCTGDENSFTYDSKPNFVDDSPNVFNPPCNAPT
ncbi:hypothetical protein Tco_0341627 [Tanacetum coccineum]